MALAGGHKPYPKHTKLGRLMFARGLRSIEVTMGSGVYPRLMTEYLAGRRRPSGRSVTMLCEFLKVRPEAILEDGYPWLPEDYARQQAREADATATDVTPNPQPVGAA